MVIDMNVSKLDTIEQIQEFLDGTAEVAFSNPTDAFALRAFVETVLRRYRYFRLSKGPRGVLFAYLQRLTGYSRLPRVCPAIFASIRCIRVIWTA